MKVVNLLKQVAFKNTAAGKYRRTKANQITSTEMATIQTKIKPMKGQKSVKGKSISQANPSDNLLELIRIEWQNNNWNTDFLDKVQSLIQVLNSEKGKSFTKKALQSTKEVVKKVPLKGVINAMKNDNLNDLMNNLGDNANLNDLLKTMMKDPEMKETAMEMLQEMMSDEKKLAEMTDMMSKLLKNDK
jgi:hypothetical protein